MNFNVNCSLSYVVNGPTTFIFNIQALNTYSQKVLQENIQVDPPMYLEQYTAHDGSSRFIRLKVQQPTTFTLTYSAVVDMNYKIIDESASANVVDVVELDSYIASFLYPSRYCQSDLVMEFAYNQFGQYNSVYETVVAITEWIYNNISYTSGSTNSQTSAIDTLNDRVGVCRDFAHLGIALCRALTIPARYFTGYAYQLNPPDFHACMEVYIDGNWIVFDSTKLAPLNGLVKIANGRDAADAAVASIFGDAYGTNVIVDCQVVDPSFQPYKYDGNYKGLSFQ
ncbi:transglutaminase family protein [Flavobacterium sp. WC2409]|jgi:transglutaminase-like putative cysteine protease|uniref:Transglutaminase family protein n=1 Tax=Flavobacterium sp. WC2409 TaxID=3234139 RepID=A0AB39W421_9FLAO